jgi:tetratricopeptide (TPR) repeat protein
MAFAARLPTIASGARKPEPLRRFRGLHLVELDQFPESSTVGSYQPLELIIMHLQLLLTLAASTLPAPFVPSDLQTALPYVPFATMVTVGQPASPADTLVQEGWDLYSQGYLSAAIAPFQQALELERTSGDVSGEAATLVALAEVYLLQGEQAIALDLSQQALELYRDLGDHGGEAEAMRLLAMAQPNDDKDLMLAKLEESQNLFEEIGTPIERGTVLADIGAMNIKREDFATGLEQLQAAIALLESTPQSAAEARRRDYYIALATAWIGLAQFRLDNPDQAFETLDQALALSQEINSLYAEALANSFLGTVHSDSENFDQAIDAFKRAVSICSRMGVDKSRDYYKSQLVGVYWQKGQAYMGEDGYEQAIESFNQVVKITKELSGTTQDTGSLKLVEISARNSINLATHSIAQAHYLEAFDLFESGDIESAYEATETSIRVAERALKSSQEALFLAEEVRGSELAKEWQLIQEANTNIYFSYGTIGSSYELKRRFFIARGQYETALEFSHKALESYQKSLVVAVDSGDSESELLAQQDIARIYTNIGDSYSELGDYLKAIEFAQKGLSASQKNIVRESLTVIELAQRSLNIDRQIFFYDLERGALWTLTLSTHNLGEQYREAGAYDKALAILKEGLGYGEQMLATLDKPAGLDQDWEQHAILSALNIYHEIAAVYEDQDDYESVLTARQDELSFSERIDDPSRKALTLSSISTAYRRLGKYQKALDIEEEILEIANKTEDLILRASRLTAIGVIYQDTGRYSEAFAAYEEALRIAREQGDFQQEIIVLSNISSIQVAQGDYSVALERLNHALTLTRDIREQLTAPDALERLDEICPWLSSHPWLSSVRSDRSESSTNDPAFINQQTKRKQQLSTYTQELCIEATWISEETLLNGLANVYSDQGYYEEALKLHEQALEINKTKSPDRRREATSLFNIGLIYHSRGEYDQALKFIQNSYELYQSIGYRQGVAYVLNSLGVIYTDQGNYPKALAVLQEAQQIIEEIDLRSLESSVLNNLGTVYFSGGKFEQAQQYHDGAMEISQQLGLQSDKAINFHNLGQLSMRQGQYAQAVEFAQQALAIYRENDLKPNESFALSALGNYLLASGNFSGAIEKQQQALALAQELENVGNEAFSLATLGITYNRLGQHEKALGYHQKSLSIYQEIGQRSGEADTLNNIGLVYEKQGEYDQALALYQQALTIQREIGEIVGEGNSLQSLGFTYERVGNYVEAEEALSQALEIQQRVGARGDEGLTYNGLGLTYAGQGDIEQGLGMLQMSLAIHRGIGRSPS